jgi:hypothetical protein
MDLGEYDSPESKIAYHRYVSEWLKTYQKKYLPGRNYVPKYRLHKASGQAFVELKGKRIYCGKHGTPESWKKYYHLIKEWLANGRTLPAEFVASLEQPIPHDE